MKHILYNMLVINEKGVLDRIAGVIRRYGGNISSVVAAEIAKVLVFPGEEELEALAKGALRVLNGEEQLKVYDR